MTFTASDGSLTNSETITITVNNVNRAPVLAAIGSKAVDENSALTFTVTATDPDGTIPTLTSSALPSGATFNGATGAFVWTPSYTQSGSYTVTFTASDGALTNSETITITVNNINRAPIATADGFTAYEDVTLTTAAPGVLGNDNDPDGDPIFAQLISGPIHGILTLNSDGSFTYTSEQDYSGLDGFTYTCTDGNAESSPASVTITVTALNDRPVALDEDYTTDEDVPLTIAAPGVLANDSDPENSPLTAVLLSGAAHGALTLNQNGSFTYTPGTEYSGVDEFTYAPSDGSLEGNAALVTITVNTVEDPPVFGPVSNKSVVAGNQVSFTVSAHDQAKLEAAGLGKAGLDRELEDRKSTRLNSSH
jgi:VCBS repeat-containing protein